MTTVTVYYRYNDPGVAGLYSIINSYNRANNRSFCTCGRYITDDKKISLTINTFQVLAIMRLDYNSLKNTNLDGTLTEQQLVQLYVDIKNVQKSLCAEGIGESTSNFTDNFIKSSSSTKYYNNMFVPSYCCGSDNEQNITLTGSLLKFVEELAKEDF
tara:strand:- start:20496 stop:20966 length:471 start_codon:yes stop_codon:yes gene_type:complete